MLIDDVKKALRVSTTSLDTEISDLIEAAKDDLRLSGVLPNKIVDTDSLIKRAIIIYCKCNFGLDNKDSEKYQRSYDSLKVHLTLSQEYNTYKITFNVTDSEGAIDGAKIAIDNETIETNSFGVAIFYTREIEKDVDYIITCSGYTTIESFVYINGDVIELVVMS